MLPLAALVLVIALASGSMSGWVPSGWQPTPGGTKKGPTIGPKNPARRAPPRKK